MSERKVLLRNMLRHRSEAGKLGEWRPSMLSDEDKLQSFCYCSAFKQETPQSVNPRKEQHTQDVLCNLLPIPFLPLLTSPGHLFSKQWDFHPCLTSLSRMEPGTPILRKCLIMMAGGRRLQQCHQYGMKDGANHIVVLHSAECQHLSQTLRSNSNH